MVVVGSEVYMLVPFSRTTSLNGSRGESYLKEGDRGGGRPPTRRSTVLAPTTTESLHGERPVTGTEYPRRVGSNTGE